MQALVIVDGNGMSELPAFFAGVAAMSAFAALIAAAHRARCPLRPASARCEEALVTDRLNAAAERAVAAAGGSKFALVGAIVARAAQLGAGWPPLVTGVEVDKFATTALREIADFLRLSPTIR
jgi:DNA-directed RNA polymerase subunit K/omega